MPNKINHTHIALIPKTENTFSVPTYELVQYCLQNYLQDYCHQIESLPLEDDISLPISICKKTFDLTKIQLLPMKLFILSRTNKENANYLRLIQLLPMKLFILAVKISTLRKILGISNILWNKFKSSLQCRPEHTRTRG